MAGGGVLDGRCEPGQGHRRYVPDIFPSQGLSEMSALDSCHQSVRAFLDTGDCPEEMTVEVFFDYVVPIFFLTNKGKFLINFLAIFVFCLPSCNFSIFLLLFSNIKMELHFRVMNGQDIRS